MGQDWKGGDVAMTYGGGQKVRLLKEALEPYKYSGNLVVMFVDRLETDNMMLLVIWLCKCLNVVNKNSLFKINLV